MNLFNHHHQPLLPKTTASCSRKAEWKCLGYDGNGWGVVESSAPAAAASPTSPPPGTPQHPFKPLRGHQAHPLLVSSSRLGSAISRVKTSVQVPWALAWWAEDWPGVPRWKAPPLVGTFPTPPLCSAPPLSSSPQPMVLTTTLVCMTTHCYAAPQKHNLNLTLLSCAPIGITVMYYMQNVCEMIFLSSTPFYNSKILGKENCFELLQAFQHSVSTHFGESGKCTSLDVFLPKWLILTLLTPTPTHPPPIMSITCRLATADPGLQLCPSITKLWLLFYSDGVLLYMQLLAATAAFIVVV